MSYTYNADGTLATKKDANGSTRTYTYLAYQRLTEIPDRRRLMQATRRCRLEPPELRIQLRQLSKQGLPPWGRFLSPDPTLRSAHLGDGLGINAGICP